MSGLDMIHHNHAMEEETDVSAASGIFLVVLLAVDLSHRDTAAVQDDRSRVRDTALAAVVGLYRNLEAVGHVVVGLHGGCLFVVEESEPSVCAVGR